MAATGVQRCLVCGDSVSGDEASYQLHLNRCLDEQRSSQPISSALRVDLAPVMPSSSAGPPSPPGLGSDPDQLDGLEHAGAQGQSIALDDDGASLGCSYVAVSVEWKGSDEGKHAVQGTGGLIPVLGKMLESSHVAGRTREGFVCVEAVEHVSFELRDAGWSCGYRNAQMVFSALRALPCYATLLPNSRGPAPIPTILEFQTIIERAWRAGHDPDGSAHFKGKLRKSRRWIGTTEIYTALAVMGVRARIVDFPKRRGGEGVHQALVNWIKDYFSHPSAPDSPSSTRKRDSPEGTAVHRTQRQPLYLQHKGHSRTVIGIDSAADGDFLLIFDPAKNIDKALVRAAGDQLAGGKKPRVDGTTTESRPRAGFGLGSKGENVQERWKKYLDPFRVSLKSLSKKDEYQVLYVEEGPVLSSDEKAQRRIVTSRVIKG